MQFIKSHWVLKEIVWLIGSGGIALVIEIIASQP